ncbi:predicted protein [Lichtheimia corymbifera JMRC:FSU:9682]|uniref:Uncharacterized protein n=1 Tax=Lichtheimia corymbifera JMRC:FSU:9682 TaxID=1263082 RepID=A0A068RJN3_9FUNG|nr:predicted protein [Lichtheimia corymbifera JMRC:FSU:9682]
MPRRDDSAMLQEQWLLQCIIPSALERLQCQLQNSLSILSKNNTKADSLPLSSAQNESLKGYITLQGAHISKAELSVRLSNGSHQDMQLKASITSDMPYFLEQIQQGANYLMLAAERMATVDQHDHALVTTVELLEDVCQYVDRAELAFEYPNETELFPYKVCHPKYFTPSLREDVVIEFCVQDVYIVCNTFALDFRNKFAATNDTHTCVMYKDKNAWIMDQCRTQTQSPMLTELKACLRSIRAICQTYRQMLLQVDG